MQKRIAHDEALFFEELLKKEINEDREAHGKRPLKEKDDNNDPPSGPAFRRKADYNYAHFQEKTT